MESGVNIFRVYLQMYEYFTWGIVYFCNWNFGISYKNGLEYINIYYILSILCISIDTINLFHVYNVELLAQALCNW